MSGIRVGGVAVLPVGVFPYYRAYFDSGTSDSYAQTWQVPNNAGSPVQVTSRTTNGDQDFSPCVSPDGTQIAFIRGVSFGSYKLYVCDADGSNVVALDTNTNCAAPVWHPDGSKILYRRGAGFHTVNPDGTGNTDVTPAGTPAGEQLNCAVYNFDGSKVVFLVDYASALTPNEVWTMNADGTGAAFLATGTRGGPIHHSCAPATDRVAYVSRVSSNHYLRRINLDGTNQTDLVGPVSTTALSLMRFAWDASESFVYYANTSSTPWTMYKADVSGSGATSLTVNIHQVALTGPYVHTNGRLYLVRRTTQDLVSTDLTGGDLRVEDTPDLVGPLFIDLRILDNGGTGY